MAKKVTFGKRGSTKAGSASFRGNRSAAPQAFEFKGTAATAFRRKGRAAAGGGS